MAKKHYKPEQIIRMLRQAEVLASQGKTVPEITRELGVSDNTYYRWRKEYGGMQVSQARKLKVLEEENGRLKRLLADAMLDNAVLKEVVAKNW